MGTPEAAPQVVKIPALSGLATWLREMVLPPDISELRQFFDSYETVMAFRSIVTNLLTAEEAAEVTELSGIEEQVWEFIRRFEAYFPLADHARDIAADSLDSFLNQVPVQWCGLDYDDYHSMEDFRLGNQICMVLAESPYHDGDGARIAMMEHLGQQYPQLGPVLGRIPDGGYPLEDIEARLGLAPEPYRGVLWTVQWIHSSTGNDLLDLDDETGWQMSLDWDRETVRNLRAMYQGMTEISDAMTASAEWLEEAPDKHLSWVLNYLEHGDPRAVPKEQLGMDLGIG